MNKKQLKMLEHFRDFEIEKNKLEAELKFNKIEDNIIFLNRENVIYALRLFIVNKINEKDLIEWINIIWWSGWFYCNENERECLASIISELDLLEDIPYLRTDHLSIDEAEYYIDALKKNKDVSLQPYKNR